MKKTSLKRVAALISAAALAAGAFSGCGSRKTAESGKKTITIWSNGRSAASIYKKCVEDFNKTNKDNIYIDFQLKSDDYVDALKAAYQSKSSPDIHPTNPNFDPGAMKNNWYRALDKETEKEFADELLLPDLFNRKTENDGSKTTISPRIGGISSFRFIYNKDLFRECGLDPDSPPKSWDEVRKYAKIITEKGNGKKYGFALPLKSNGFIHYYVLYPAVASGVLLINGYNCKEAKFEYSKYADMIDVLKDIQNDGSMFPSPATIDNDTARAQFAEGNVGMMTAASWDVAVFNEQFPAKFDWGCVDFPTINGEAPAANPGVIGGGASYVMSTQSKYPDEQLEVFKWFVGPETCSKVQEAGLGNFGYKKLVGADKINGDKKGAKELYSVSNPAFLIEGDSKAATPFSHLKIEGDTYSDTIAAIIKANLDTKSTLKDLDERYNAALKTWIKEEKPVKELYINKDWTGIVDIDALVKE